MPETVHDGVNASNDVYASAHPKKHARIPPEVYGDPKLTDRDVRVFAVLAQFQRKTPLSHVGMRHIGQIINAPYQKVCVSIARLVECGHIKRLKESSGKRQSYWLLSPIFAAKTGKPAASAQREQPKAEAAVPTLPACAECKRTDRKVNKACHCAPCAKKQRGVHPKVFAAIDAKIERHMQRLRAS